MVHIARVRGQANISGAPAPAPLPAGRSTVFFWVKHTHCCLFFYALRKPSSRFLEFLRAATEGEAAVAPRYPPRSPHERPQPTDSAHSETPEENMVDLTTESPLRGGGGERARALRGPQLLLEMDELLEESRQPLSPSLRPLSPEMQELLAGLDEELKEEEGQPSREAAFAARLAAIERDSSDDDDDVQVTDVVPGAGFPSTGDDHFSHIEGISSKKCTHGMCRCSLLYSRTSSTT